MKKVLLAVLFSVMGLTAFAQVERPKLVVGLVVDQMRWDYLYYYREQYQGDGLNRLVDEGYSFDNCLINYVPTVTAIGHSSIYTGSVPSLTGIAGNSFFIDGEETTSVRDLSVSTVGAPDGRPGKRSPRNLLATTIGDELKLATDFKSKVIGVALKDRASILPAGHSADGAYWWDGDAGHFVTSSYYMSRLPQWVEDFNKTHYTAPKYDIKTSNEGVTMTFDMAIAAIEGEQLGQDDITDLLAVSISSTDAIGHEYSTRGKENYEVYMQLDKDLARFLSVLDSKVGRGNYLLFLTADHGAVHNPNFLKSHKQPGGSWSNDQCVKRMNSVLSSRFGADKLVKCIMDCRCYLNRSLIKERGLDYAIVKAAVVELLLAEPEVQYAVDYEQVATSSIPAPLREQIINGYNRERSGDVFVAQKSQFLGFQVDEKYKGTSHGAWNPYDAHIPMVFYGWHVPHGRSVKQTSVTDFAPTVCALLHIQQPSCCIGKAVEGLNY